MSHDRASKAVKDTRLREKSSTPDTPKAQNLGPSGAGTTNIADLQRIIGNHGVQQLLLQRQVNVQSGSIQLTPQADTESLQTAPQATATTEDRVTASESRSRKQNQANNQLSQFEHQVMARLAGLLILGHRVDM